jgi:SAM-dependent methyltransferase
LGEAVGLRITARSLLRRLLPRPARRALRIAAAEGPRRLRDLVPDLLRRDGLPPAGLRFHVAGSSDRRSFVAIGAQAASEITAAVARHRSLDDMHDVLDFGCGCGRVSVPVARALPHARMSGIDVDTRAVRWCQRHLDGDWRVTTPDPPTPFAASSFHVVYAVSVFTHLPEARQRAWIGELHRLLRDGGLLVVTTLGPGLTWSRPDLTAEQRAQLDGRGFVFAAGGASFNEDSSFQSRAYVERDWAPFRLLEHSTHGLAAYQDLSVLQK